MPSLKSRLSLATALGMLVSGTLTMALASGATAVPVTPTTKVSITKNHVVHMPQQLAPGVNRFAISSGGDAAFQIVQAAHGYTKRRLAHDVNTGLSQGKVRYLKRFEANVTLLGGVASAADHPGVLFVRLPAGTYWVADTDARVTRAEKLLTIHVGGAPTGAVMPQAAVVRAINEADWGHRPASISHDGLLTFRNRSADNHFVAMAKLLPGKTMRDFRRWLDAIKNGQNPGPPPVDENIGLDTGVVSPGHSMTMHYRLPRGRYAMMCWWPDAEQGGMPHAFMGMVRGITLD